MKKFKINSSIVIIILGILISSIGMFIFPSENNFGGIYAILGIIISFVGFSKFTKKLKCVQKLLYNFIYFILFLCLLFTIDYLNVVTNNKAPRFVIYSIAIGNIIYYDTPFYDVIRYNAGEKDEKFEVIANQKYDIEIIKRYIKL